MKITQSPAVHRIPFLGLIIMVCASCSRPVAPGHVRLKLDRPQRVSLGLFDHENHLVAQPLAAATLAAGEHEIDCRRATPPGTYRWEAVAFDAVVPELVASVGTGLKASSPERKVAGGDLGPPCAVAADEQGVYLGWQAAQKGHEIVATAPDGKVLWAHHHGHERASGVKALAVDGGSVFALADADGTKLYRLDARTGAPLNWDGPAIQDLAIKSLWGTDANVKPTHADYLTARNGRLYLTFAEDQFVAVLDARTGDYVTTLTGPQLGPMSFTITPMRDNTTGEVKAIDFGVAAIAGNGLAYFLMEHEPPWVMMSTTRWLQPDERVVALTLYGDTMRDSNLTVYTALGEPHHQVQLRPADTVEGYNTAVGAPGGRQPMGPWKPDALADIRAIAVDAAGQLWVAETKNRFGRFTVWKTEGKDGELVREIFGPLDASTLAMTSTDPLELWLGDFRWKIDVKTRAAACVEMGANALPALPAAKALANAGGLLLWTPPTEEQESWGVYQSSSSSPPCAIQRSTGVEVYRFNGLETVHSAGAGTVSIAR